MIFARTIDAPTRRAALVVLATGLLGCGPGSASLEQGDGPTHESSESSESSESTTTGPGDSESGEPSTTDSSDGETTDASTDDTTDTSTDDTTGELVGPIAYCADLYVGGHDRVQLWRRDLDTDTCTVIRIVYFGPGWDGPMLEISSPDYTTERIRQMPGAEQCGTNDYGDASAITAEGTVTFVEKPQSWVPESIDVDATLTFDPVEPWIVAEVLFQIEGLTPADHGCDEPFDEWVEG